MHVHKDVVKLAQYLYKAMGWRCIPWGASTGCNWLRRSRSTPQWARDSDPFVSTTIDEKCAARNEGHGSRHFHQLFRQLRLKNRTVRDGELWDLGHCDDMLGDRSVEELEEVHQLVHHLRHCYVEESASCSTACRWTRSCGPRGSTRPFGRVPHTASSSSNSEKNAVSPATLVFDVQCVASLVLAVSRPHSSLNFGGNGAEEWWKVSARTMRTVCRSCFSHERSRRSRLLLAATLARSTSDMSTAEV